MNAKKLLSVLLVTSSILTLSSCGTSVMLQPKEYPPNAQIQRQWKRLEASDIGVAQVRVVKPIDTDCAGVTIPIYGEENYKTSQEAFANYWKEALMTDLREAGLLNQSKPKVKLYALIDYVKIQADPSALVYRLEMEVFSSNGHMIKQEISYNIPSDNLKNIHEGCVRIAEGLDRAVSWSILKIISDPRFAQLVTPGLGYEPTMKAESLSSVLDVLGKDNDQDHWKTKP